MISVNEFKLDELAHNAATEIEGYFDVSNGEVVGFDFANAKQLIRATIIRYIESTHAEEEVVTTK